MSAPPYPVDEAERLLALQRTELLDSAPEERFDRITRLAAHFFGVQTCLVSLVDSDRQWFKSKVGLEQQELGRDISFCGHAILDRVILTVPDAALDQRFHANPLVTGEPHIRFYAGAPLREPTGQPIGTLCLIDNAVRDLSEKQTRALRDFADMVEHEIASVDQAEFQRKLIASGTKTSSILGTLPDMVFVIDRHYRVLVCGEHPDLFCPRQEMLGRTIGEVLPTELGRQLTAQVESAFGSNEVVHFNYTVAETSQSFEARVKKIDHREVLVIIRNTTQQAMISTELKRLSEVARQTTNSVIITDTNGLAVWVNEAFTAITGYRLEEMLGKRPGELLQGDDTNPAAIHVMSRALASNKGFEVDVLNYSKQRTAFWFRITCNPLWDDEGELQGHIAIQSDITREKHDAELIREKESTLHEQSKQMQAIVDNMLDGVISIDGKGAVLTFNRAAEHIFGYRSDEVVGHNVNLLMSSPHRENHDTYLANYIHTGVGNVIGQNRELEALRKDGTLFPIELGLAQVQQAGEISFIGIIRDITQRKKGEDEIRQLAFYDPLTQLPNRRLLLDRMQQVLANCARQERYAALLFMDLDNFKSLNDSAGHDKGDLLLCQVAQRLVECVRQGDTVSRLGGDEFVVIIENLSGDEQEAANQAEAAAEKIIGQLRQGFDLDGLAYTGSASIGISMFNGSCFSRGDLVKQADMAMYKAKAAGRNGIRFFDPQMQIAVSLRAAMEQDLHDAIQQQQFQLYYQKQIDQQGHVIGAEVLLRWLHPTKGIISPAQFIPLAEESGLIVPIGEWALREACRTLAQWSSEPARGHLTIAVNISVVQFKQNDIVQTVLKALEDSGAPASNLKLEITESLLASNFQDVKAKMLELQSHGVSFSIDDFGTGYSSLFYLKQLPINQLKIDQSFVRDIINSANDQAIAQAVITLADAMQLSVIAEGVETEGQRVLLQKLGCEAYQGYLYGRPCTLEDLDI